MIVAATVVVLLVEDHPGIKTILFQVKATHLKVVHLRAEIKDLPLPVEKKAVKVVPKVALQGKVIHQKAAVQKVKAKEVHLPVVVVKTVKGVQKVDQKAAVSLPVEKENPRGDVAVNK